MESAPPDRAISTAAPSGISLSRLTAAATVSSSGMERTPPFA